MKVPAWAQDLTINAMLYLESKGYAADLPELRWRHSHYNASSGVCCHGDHITVTAGTKRRDARMVLLHELAHWVLPTCEHHGNLFWRTAFDLYRAMGLPLRICVNRESRCLGRSAKRLNKLAHEALHNRSV